MVVVSFGSTDLALDWFATRVLVCWQLNCVELSLSAIGWYDSVGLLLLVWSRRPLVSIAIAVVVPLLFPRFVLRW